MVQRRCHRAVGLSQRDVVLVDGERSSSGSAGGRCTGTRWSPSGCPRGEVAIDRRTGHPLALRPPGTVASALWPGPAAGTTAVSARFPSQDERIVIADVTGLA